MQRLVEGLHRRDYVAAGLFVVCFSWSFWTQLAEAWWASWIVLRLAGLLWQTLGLTLAAIGIALYASRRSRHAFWRIAVPLAITLAAPIAPHFLLVAYAPSVAASAAAAARWWASAVLAMAVVWSLSSRRWGLPAIAVTVAVGSVSFALSNYWFGRRCYDIGIFNQTLASTLYGGQFFFSSEGVSHFAFHNSPILFLLLPVYAVGRGSGLLVAQSLAVVSSVIPLRLLLDRLGLERTYRNLACAGFLLLPMILGPTLDKFHELPFALPLFLWAFYFFEIRRPGLSFLFMAASMLVRENVPFVILGFVVYALARRRRWYWAVVPGAMAAGWILLTFRVIFPAFGHGDFGAVGAGVVSWMGTDLGSALLFPLRHPGEVARQLLIPRNRIFVEALFPSLGAVLPLLSLPAIFSLPDLLVKLLSRAEGSNTWSLDWHYYVLMAASLTIALFYTMRGVEQRFRLHRRVMSLGIVLFCFGSVKSAVQWVSPPGLPDLPAYRAQQAAYRAIATTIPTDERVAANPRVSLFLSETHWRSYPAESNLAQGNPTWVVTAADDLPAAGTSPEHLRGEGYRPVRQTAEYTIWRAPANARDGRREGERR